MIIRNINPQDVLKISQIDSASFERPWTEKMFIEELSLSSSISFIIEENTPLGYIFARDLGDNVEVLRIAVVPEKRKCGLGRSLLSHLCSASQNRPLILEVDEKNSAAYELYSSAGFILTGRRRAYYGKSDALLMDRPANNEDKSR